MLPPIHKALEECSFNALPARHTLFYDGWVIRLAGGGPKRANSVNVLSPSALGLEQKLAYCGELFQRQDCPTTFRLTDHAHNQELDFILAKKGFARVDESIVMTADLSRIGISNDTRLDFRVLPAQEWFAQMMRLDHASDARKQKHVELLNLLALPAIYGSVEVADRCAAIGLLVMDGAYAGIFDVVTDIKMRRQGYARMLIQSLFGRARHAGCTVGYLQVVAANVAAVTLYESLGFTPCYRYWYRVAP